MSFPPVPRTRHNPHNISRLPPLIQRIGAGTHDGWAEGHRDLGMYIFSHPANLLSNVIQTSGYN